MSFTISKDAVFVLHHEKKEQKGNGKNKCESPCGCCALGQSKIKFEEAFE